MRRLPLVTLLLFWVVGLSLPDGAHAQTIPVSIPDVTGEVGFTTTIDIVADPGDLTYSAFNAFTFTYDPNVLKINAVSAGSVTDEWSLILPNLDNERSGTVVVSGAAGIGPPVSSSGSILTLDIELLAPGSTTLNLTGGEFQHEVGGDEFNYPADPNPGTITVTAGDPPNANDDSATTTRNTPIDISVLSNDNDPEGGDLIITEVSTPTIGTATIINSGTQVRYTPATDVSGVATFTYTIEDPEGNEDTATVTVNVNNAPTANNDSATTNEDTPVVINVLSNDTDIDGTLNPATVTVTSGPSNGSANVNTTTGAITYAPSSNFSGGDSFTYTVQDDDGATSNAATVTLSVTAQNDAPAVNNALPDLALNEDDAPVSIDLGPVFSDPEGDNLTYSATSSNESVATATIENAGASLSATSGDPSVATASLQDATLIITPIGPGTTTITVTATDPSSANAQDQFTVTVNANTGNQPPIVVNPIPDQTVSGDTTPLQFDLDTVFDDPDGDHLIYSSSSSNSGVAGTGISGSTLTVTPRANGTATVAVTAIDPSGATTRDNFTVTANDIVAETETYVALLSGANEVPANASRATGEVVAVLQDNTLSVSGFFQDLSSPFNPNIGGGAHIHLGLFGQNGPVTIPLNTTLATDQLRGNFEESANTFELDNEQLAALEARGLYVNIHTNDYPAGELRGQLIPSIALGEETGEALFRAILSGRAEIPANTSQAVGGVLVEYRDGTLILSGAFSGLESDFNPEIGGGSHLHQANIDENGPVVIPLQATVGTDETRGTFAAGQNTFVLDDAQTAALFDGELYVNIHTDNLTAGEVRGQVLPITYRVFEAYLSGANEVPAVSSGGAGSVLAVYDEEHGALMVSGTFRDLASPFATNVGAHLHEATADATGGVVQPLTVVLSDTPTEGTFRGGDNFYTPAQSLVDALYAGAIYANVHSQDNPSGELRGQLLPSTNQAPAASTITSPADGVSFDLGEDPAMPIAVTWNEAADPNGNPVYYRWQLALDASFNNVVFEAQSGSQTQVATTFGELDDLLESQGVADGAMVTLYHRVVATDGSFQTRSPTASASLTRDTGTASEGYEEQPARFVLHGNYPNPFNPTTTITFDLPEAATVHVEVLDLLGRHVLTVPRRSFASGSGHTIRVDATTLASGTYLYRVVAETSSDAFMKSGHMLLLK